MEHVIESSEGETSLSQRLSQGVREVSITVQNGSEFIPLGNDYTMKGLNLTLMSHRHGARYKG